MNRINPTHHAIHEVKINTLTQSMWRCGLRLGMWMIGRPSRTILGVYLGFMLIAVDEVLEKDCESDKGGSDEG